MAIAVAIVGAVVGGYTAIVLGACRLASNKWHPDGGTDNE